MTDIRKDQAETAVARRSIVSLRIGYIVSLMAIAIMCAFFFVEQSERNRSIQQIGDLSRRFADVDHSMRAIAERSNRLAQTYIEYQAFVDPRLANATLADKRKIRDAMPVDQDLISALSEDFASQGSVGGRPG